MSWTKLDPILPKNRGCILYCGTLIQEAPMDMLIAVGFGVATVTKDGEKIYSELDCCEDVEKMWTVQDAENEALKDPDHDWRITLFAPLRGRVFQRHGDGRWILVKENRGFEEWKNAQEQGLLVKFPCKVGDTVYEPRPDRGFISVYKIAMITITSTIRFKWMVLEGIYSNLDGFSIDDIGKRVFLTREQAEQALKEMEVE